MVFKKSLHLQTVLLKGIIKKRSWKSHGLFLAVCGNPVQLTRQSRSANSAGGYKGGQCREPIEAGQRRVSREKRLRLGSGELVARND